MLYTNKFAWIIKAELTSYLSQALTSQPAIIHSVSIKTSNTVPGQIVISVFRTNFVSKWMRLSAPILLDEASVKSLLCSNMTRQMRYSLKNIGTDKTTSKETSFRNGLSFLAKVPVQKKVQSPGIGWMAQIINSSNSWRVRRQDIAILQSSTQLSTAKSWR